VLPHLSFIYLDDFPNLSRILCHGVWSFFLKKRGENEKRKAGAPWSLVGKFFHSFTRDLPRKGRGEVQNQGVVLSNLGGGYFVIQLFDWVLGDPSSTLVVHIERMASNGWEFYESATEMSERYEHYYRFGGRRRAVKPKRRIRLPTA
jgi:hypothetical protein